MDHFAVRHACVSIIDNRVITLGEYGQIRLNLEKLMLDFSASYKLGTKPNFWEEEGKSYFFSYGTLTLSNALTMDEEGILHAKTKEFQFSGARAEISFTGSYVSQAFGGLLTYMLNTAIDIFVTQTFLMNQHPRGNVIIQDLINIGLDAIPTETFIGNDLFVTGGLNKAPTVIKDESVALDFNYQVQGFTDYAHPR